MSKNMKLFRWCLLSLALLLSFASCSSDNTSSGGFKLYYSSVTNIGPSMTTICSPSYYGGTPSSFAIYEIKLDNQRVGCESFSINEESGTIALTGTDGMTPGKYSVSVSCLVDGAKLIFPDIFNVNMFPAVPVELQPDVEVLEIPYAELADSDSSITLTPVGECVTITGYMLEQPEDEKYFAISTEGVISLNKKFSGDILPGIYPLTVKVMTHAGEATYENLVTIKITSLPIELTYNPAVGRMEYNTAYESNAPRMKGSPESVLYSIKGVTPESDKFVIDPQTGVLSVAAESGLEVDGHYVVDVTVENLYGATDFMGAFALDIIAYIEPIDAATLAYDDVEAIQGTAFTAEKRDGFVGDEVAFSLGALPAELEGQLSIDVVTGAVSAAKGNTIPVGSYTVPVLAKNTKNEVEGSLTLNIIENPYYFTRITYGNNLGLDPLTNANQFVCASAGDMSALDLTPETDAKPGTEIEWSLVIKHQCSGTVIDPETGVITPAGFKGTNAGLVVVTATAGRGTVGETTVVTPVFFSFNTGKDGDGNSPIGIPYEYKPFVYQVNPRKGGISHAPEISSSCDASQLVLDYRRTFNYYNIAGPSSHVDGNKEGSFLTYMIGVYNAQSGIKETASTSNKVAFSYFKNQADLTLPLLYIENSTKQLVVPAGKWIDADNVAANGAFLGQITFTIDGTEPSNGYNTFPVWVWFDEKF